MNHWIVLFLGINVGGKNIVVMKQLKETLLGLGCQKVETYIQSGNVVLQHPEPNAQVLSTKIACEIEVSFGFQAQVLVLTLAKFQQAVANNPFPEAQADPKTLHLYFLAAPAENVTFDKMNQLKKDSEMFKLVEQVFYLHAPDGIGRSKLAEK